MECWVVCDCLRFLVMPVMPDGHFHCSLSKAFQRNVLSQTRECSLTKSVTNDRTISLNSLLEQMFCACIS